MRRLCFLDMDGVLADFVGGMCEAHDRPAPYPAGEFNPPDMAKLWGLGDTEFWKPANTPGFWFGLSKTPEADALVELAVSTFGLENVAILTAPNLYSGCVAEKGAWISHYYPQLKRQVIFAQAKQFLGGPGRMLVDDQDKNIDPFNAAGGVGMHIPRLWNTQWREAGRSLEAVKEGMKYWMRRGF